MLTWSLWRKTWIWHITRLSHQTFNLELKSDVFSLRVFQWEVHGETEQERRPEESREGGPAVCAVHGNTHTHKHTLIYIQYKACRWLVDLRTCEYKSEDALPPVVLLWNRPVDEAASDKIMSSRLQPRQNLMTIVVCTHNDRNMDPYSRFIKPCVCLILFHAAQSSDRRTYTSLVSTIMHQWM